MNGKYVRFGWCVVVSAFAEVAGKTRRIGGRRASCAKTRPLEILQRTGWKGWRSRELLLLLVSFLLVHRLGG